MIMVSIGALKAELLSYLGEEPVAFVCVRIIEYAAKQKPANLKMLTYRSLAKAARLDVGDPVLVMAVHTLAMSRRFQVLDKHYLLRDYDGCDRPINDEDVRRAYIFSRLVLSDGSVISDVDSHLVPYFSASKLLLEAKAIS